MKIKIHEKVTLTMTGREARMLSYILEFAQPQAYEKAEEKHIKDCRTFMIELNNLIDGELL